ncbi:TVP38/TMEM64 family protein [Aureisphaera sp.]
MKKIIIPFLFFATAIIVVFLVFGNLEQYFQTLLEEAQSSTSYYSLLSFAILCSDIILPVPSSIVMHFNGMVLGALYGGLLSLVSVMISSVLGYYLGKFTRWGKRSQKDASGVSFLHKYGVFAIIISRGIPILSESIVLLCGYHRINFKTFIIYSLIGYIPVCWIYAYFGSLSNDLFLIAVSVSLLISVITWYIGKRMSLHPSSKV